MAFPWCVTLVPEVEGQARGAVLKDAKWPKGSEIKISFLDGDSGLQAKVKAAAEQWITRTGADLTFTWLNNSGAGDIRISFTRKGSWSLLGRYAKLRTDKSEPTMNFGWLKPDSDDLAIQEVVLHEFGHALGFIHEHQNPDGGLLWNEQKVIASLSGPQTIGLRSRSRQTCWANTIREA
ncbi:MAG: M12 family metallopeptidase [Planctomycetaceae bacterium]